MKYEDCRDEQVARNPSGEAYLVRVGGHGTYPYGVSNAIPVAARLLGLFKRRKRYDVQVFRLNRLHSPTMPPVLCESYPSKPRAEVRARELLALISTDQLHWDRWHIAHTKPTAPEEQAT